MAVSPMAKRKIAPDGQPYTKKEFKEYYGKDSWQEYWSQAKVADNPDNQPVPISSIRR